MSDEQDKLDRLADALGEELVGGDKPGRFCAAVYDPPRRKDRSDTHTCDKTEDHGGPHHCDVCGAFWMARVGVKEWSGGDREQVEAARKDAISGGVGLVQVSWVTDEDGEHRFHYQRIDPVLVTIRDVVGDAGDAGDEE